MEKSMPLHSLKTFQVHDNPWYCDCALRWVFNHTVKQGLLAVSSCSGPLHLQGKPWSVLYPSDFACAPHVRLANGDESAQMAQIDNGTMQVVKGSSVVLSCVVYSDPVGLSNWYRNGERISQRDSRIAVSIGRPALGSLKANNTYFSEVKFTETNENDSAVYSCEVLNSAGAASANVTLTIVESASESQPNTLQKSLARIREATALHYALIACCAIACVVTLISVVACAFYCTKRFLLMRYSSRCRAYQPAKHRSCNFVDNYNCFDTHLNMLNDVDTRCEYANIVESNDGAGYFADIHHQNLPLKGTMVILKPDGTACHHVMREEELNLNVNQQPACPCELTPTRSPNLHTPRADLTPLGNAPDPINAYDAAGTVRSITFKPAISSQLSGSSFNTLTLLKSSRRHNANATGAFYAPIASYEDDQIGHGNNHRRTASTSTFTNTPSRLANSDQASLV